MPDTNEGPSVRGEPGDRARSGASADAMWRTLTELSAIGEVSAEAVIGQLQRLTGARAVVFARADDDGALLGSRIGPVAEIQPYRHAVHATPHELAIERGRFFCRRELAARFPADALARELRAESYLGVSLQRTSGSPHGVLAAYFDYPLLRARRLAAVFALAALRIQAELERTRLEPGVWPSLSSEVQLHHILTCVDGVWMIDAQGVTSFVNPQMAEMLQCETRDMIGRPLLDFVPEDGRAQLERNLERRRSGIREHHEFRFVKRGGGELWAELSTTPIYDQSGAFKGALALVKDVTERRGLEAKLQQAQKLESLALLAGGVAHDFNNLLVGILGNVAMALSEVEPDSPIAGMLQDAESSAKRASELTKQMLAYSGKGRFILSQIDLNQLIEEMRSLLGSAVPKTVTLVVEPEHALPIVHADVGQMRQLIVNLVSNAADALAERPGRIVLRTGSRHVSREELGSYFCDDALPPGDYVFLEVADDGAGMDPATAARIFDPFFTTKFTGRGLGLAAVFGIVRGHRGAVRVESELGTGTTFRLLFPALEAAAVRAEPASAPPESGTFTGSGYVLVADDEETVRNVARRVLEQRGFRVLVAHDGLDAVRLFREHAGNVALVLLDLTMPGLGSEAVYRELTQLQPGVRVILTSGYSEQDVASNFSSEGLAGFLQKPWGPDELLTSLRRALGA